MKSKSINILIMGGLMALAGLVLKLAKLPIPEDNVVYADIASTVMVIFGIVTISIGVAFIQLSGGK